MNDDCFGGLAIIRRLRCKHRDMISLIILLLYCNAIIHAFCPNIIMPPHSPATRTTTTSSSAVHTAARPNPSTYWVVENQFLAGEYPAAAKGGELESRSKLCKYLEKGVTLFLDLTHEGEREDYQALLYEEAKKMNRVVEYKRIHIEDFGVPDKTTMKEILKHLDDAMSRNKTAYVHCRGGIGRTGTTVGCWLVQNQSLTGEEALIRVNQLFQASERRFMSSQAPETQAQMDFIRDWGVDK